MCTHRLFAAVEKFRIVDGVIVVGPYDVEAQTFRRLVGHLDTVLQDGHWEGGGWVTGQPQAEVRVSLLWVELLADKKICMCIYY